MNDIERQISAFLHDEARAVSQSDEIDQRVLKRARLNRALTTTVAGIAALSAIMVGFVAVGELRSSPTQPAGRSSGSPTPAHEVPAETVGQGTVEGQTWTLVAYVGADGLCVDLEVGDGTSNVCGFDVPGQRNLEISESSQHGVSRTAIHGVVSKEVQDLRVMLSDGEEIEVDIIQGPTGFDVDFFAAFLPPDAEGVVEARGSKGILLDSRPISPLPARPN